MDHLIIEETKFTMRVDFNAETGICNLFGNSYPEDAIVFFEPINAWFIRFVKEVKKPIVLNITLNYVNSSSSKCFMDIFDLLEDYFTSDGKVTVNWFYEEDDDEIKEAGEELLEDMSFEVNYITLSE